MNEYHPVVLGADTTDMETGAFQGLAEGVKYGIPSAAASGVLSMYNSTVGFITGNQVDTQEVLDNYSQETGDYYKEHKQGVDMVGMIATSLIPGTIAMKGVQMLRAGNGAGSLGKALGFASSRKDKYLQAAIQDIGATGGTIAKLGTANGLRYAAWETADQMLLSAAFEVGVVATMHQSPVFSTDTYTDFAKNMAIGTVFGGAVGGAISSLMGRGILKHAAEAVQERSRQIDTVFEADRLALAKGTQSYVLAREIAMLPDVAKEVPFNFKLDGTERTITINSEAALLKAKERAVKTAENKLAIQFTELAGGDANFGQAYYKLIQDRMKASSGQMLTGENPADVIHGYLQNVAKVEHIDLDRYAIQQQRFYIDSVPKGETAFERMKNTLTPTRSATTSRTGYRFVEDVTMYDVKIGDLDQLGAKNLKEAYKANPDLDLVRLPDGRLTVNPKSEYIKRVSETPYTVNKYVHLESGTISSETIPTFADIVAKGDVRVTDTGISAGGGKTYAQPASIATHAIADPLQASARWAWAAKLELPQLLRISKGTIDLEDLPLIARFNELSKGMSETDLAKWSIKEATGTVSAGEYINFSEAVHAGRSRFMTTVLTKAAAESEKSVPSTQHWAAYLNTPVDYVDSLITAGLKVSNMDAKMLAESLATGTALVPKNLMVQWNFGVAKTLLPEEAYRLNMGPNHLAAKELTAQYQMLIRKDIGTKAQETTLGEHMANFRPAPDAQASGVTAQGAGASTFGASNADYAKAANLWVQDTGKAVALTVQRVRDAAIEALAPAINAIRGDLSAAAELGAITTALRASPHRFSLVDDVVDGVAGKRLVSREANRLMATGEFDSLDDAIEFARAQDGVAHEFPIKKQPVIDFLTSNAAMNDTRNSKFTTLYNAAGMNTHLARAGEIYVPPINTQRFPFFALVKPKKTVGLGSDVSMITARSEVELRKMADSIGDKFDIHYKADTDAYYRARGEYDYQMTLNEGGINAELHRSGVLADIMPETRPENVLTDWLEHVGRQEEKLVRTAVQVGNRQFFSELNFLSETYRTTAESQVRGLGASLKSKIADPFGDYIKTALNISKQGEFPLLDSLNDLVDKAGLRAGAAIAEARDQANKGYLPWDKAAKVMKEYGLGQGLDESLYHIANGSYPTNVIKTALNKGNLWLATTTLRLDFINPLINMISTPIMIGTEVSALKRLMGGDTELAKAFQETMSVAGPGGRSMPSTVKLIGNAINNYFGAEKQVLFDRFKRIGAIKDVNQQYHDILGDLSYTSGLNQGKYAAQIEAAIEKGAKITGNTFAEDFTRFVSADVMRQISDTLVKGGKLTAKEQDSLISSFVNKVQGNYVTSQRPVIFQGTTGAAVSLFQTYAFNVLQQLTRHIENGDKRTLMMFAGLQGSMFGLNGLPFFDALNTHLVGGWLANNPQHNDSYNILPKFNKELGDWALYGSASAFPLFSERAPALYTRGDINPRYLTILPNSFVDIPLVNASIKLYDSVMGFAGNVGRGTDVSRAALQALEHQGWNRPLAGLAQTFNGQATTSKGALVSSANELDTTSKLMQLQDRMIDFGGVQRMLGARPMDEAVALNNLFRSKDYEALDRDRIDRLGYAVKSKLYGNEVPSQDEMEDFMVRYTRSGGRIENFQQSMHRWSKDANVSIINQAMARTNTPSGVKLKMIMGGEGLDDYANAETPLNYDPTTAAEE